MSIRVASSQLFPRYRMGVVLSRLWTTKRSFRDHLEHLEAEIKRIETAQQRNAIIKRQVNVML